MKLPSARWFKSVLKEFEENGPVFICLASKRFKRQWNNSNGHFKEGVKARAEEWIREYRNTDVTVGDCSLFVRRSQYLTSFTTRRIRIEFLKWLIKKLEK